MRTKGPYQIAAYQTAETDCGCDFDDEADTLTEARHKARHFLSPEFAASGEMSGRFSRVTVTDANGDCVIDLFRDVDPAIARAARKLSDTAQTRALYADPRIEGAARFDKARAVLDYPRDVIELRDAYSPDGEDRWVRLTPAACLFNQRGESIRNPLAAA